MFNVQMLGFANVQICKCANVSAFFVRMRALAHGGHVFDVTLYMKCSDLFLFL